MARRIRESGRIHPIYAVVGPVMSRAIRACGGDVERAEQIRADWEAWRDEYQLAWSRGKGVPPPPHQDLFR